MNNNRNPVFAKMAKIRSKQMREAPKWKSPPPKKIPSELS